MATETLTLQQTVSDGHVNKTTTRASGRSASQLSGTLWFIGWLFTIGYAQLVWWKALLAVVLWPYFLGASFH